MFCQLHIDYFIISHQGKRIKFVAFSAVHAFRCCIYGLQRQVAFAGESLLDDVLAFVSSIADKCQQSCRQMSATLLTNVKRSLYLTFASKVLVLFCRLTRLYADGSSLLWPWPFDAFALHIAHTKASPKAAMAADGDAFGYAVLPKRTRGMDWPCLRPHGFDLRSQCLSCQGQKERRIPT